VNWSRPYKSLEPHILRGFSDISGLHTITLHYTTSFRRLSFFLKQVPLATNQLSMVPVSMCTSDVSCMSFRSSAPSYNYPVIFSSTKSSTIHSTESNSYVHLYYPPPSSLSRPLPSSLSYPLPSSLTSPLPSSLSVITYSCREMSNNRLCSDNKNMYRSL